MNRITINVPETQSTYPIDFVAGFHGLWDSIQSQINGRRVLFITDTNLAQKSEFIQVLPESHVLVLEPGEKTKNFASIEKVIYRCQDEGLDKDSILVAVGGGVIGDLTGFAASIYLRGISYIQIPTTLLAMVDSSVGGKTGIDTNQRKNIIGSFYSPEAVFICAQFFDTLPNTELKNGLVEMIKHGVIESKEHFDALESIASNPPHRNSILPLIPDSIQIKQQILQKSETKILNFGSALGSSIEQISSYTIPYGQVVAMGMILELSTAEKNNLSSPEITHRVRNLFESFSIKINPPYSDTDIWKEVKRSNSSELFEITHIEKIGKSHTTLIPFPKHS